MLTRSWASSSAAQRVEAQRVGEGEGGRWECEVEPGAASGGSLTHFAHVLQRGWEGWSEMESLRRCEDEEQQQEQEQERDGERSRECPTDLPRTYQLLGPKLHDVTRELLDVAIRLLHPPADLPLERLLGAWGWASAHRRRGAARDAHIAPDRPVRGWWR